MEAIVMNNENNVSETTNVSLHEAVIKGNMVEIECLLSSGADIDVKDFCGRTPLQEATFNCYGDNYLKEIEILLVNGANANTRDTFLRTPLDDLMGKENSKTIELLLNFGANVNARNDLGQTPLHKAVIGKDFENIRLLIDRGADVNARDNDRLTPLHLACDYKHLKVIKYLIKNGAGVDALDSTGCAPLVRLLRPSHYSVSEEILWFCLEYYNFVLEDRNIMSIPFLTSYASIILQHIAKLQAFDLRVSQRIFTTISKYQEYRIYFDCCEAELLLAKSSKLGVSWITFFDLLVESRRRLKNYAGNGELMREFTNSDCLKIFPIYGKRMVKKVEKGLERRKLFDESALLLSECLPIFNPNHLVVRDVLDCLLSVKDLSKLCEKKMPSRLIIHKFKKIHL